MIKNLLITLVTLLFGLSLIFQVKAEDAETLFNTLEPALYQIRIIEKNSGSKSSIGSGFQIDEDGVIATNYHVISEFVQHPNKYKLQYLDQQGNSEALTVLDVDVINDLALVKRQSNTNQVFKIAPMAPAQGEKIFSLGNPHDLGMIVVPGTYNGLKKQSFHDRIHFTGSVNPGMSGGPVVNESGEVVGVNVATAGNQIGFLIPLDKLVSLYQQYEQRGAAVDDLKLRIRDQLFANQQRLFGMLLSGDWQLKKLGNAIIPAEIAPFIRCWGASNADKPKAKFLSVSASCTMSEQIYISNKFQTGNISMEYEWLNSKELNSLQFYNMYQSFISRMGPDNKASKQNVSQFECSDNLVFIGEEHAKSKSVLCARAYKEYPGLYDIAFISASYDKSLEGIISHFTLSGVEQQLAMQFAEKFMGLVTWN